MRPLLAAMTLCLVVFAGHSARAEVADSTASAFLLRYEATVAATPDQAYRSLAQLPRWWNGAHSYSGDARHLSLDLRAGGCFCERWDGNAVEHARVVMVLASGGARTVRLEGGLGPLQELGVSGVLTFTLTPEGQGAKISMTYRVAGEPGLALDAMAAPVDGVLQEQFDRFIRYTAG